MTCDTSQVGGGEPSLKMSAPKLLRFVNESVLKIFLQRVTEYSQLINYKGVCRIAPATPGLLTGSGIFASLNF